MMPESGASRQRPSPDTGSRLTLHAAMETSDALLLRRHRLTESSLIITWFTRLEGKIKTVAKGALRPKSPFAGRLDLFFHAEITWARSRRTDLHSLREASLLQTHPALRTDYRKVQLASYFSDLLDMATAPEDPAPELFDLLLRGLGYLADAPADLRALRHFESEVARLLGLQSARHASGVLAEAIGRLPANRAELLRLLPA